MKLADATLQACVVNLSSRELFAAMAMQGQVQYEGMEGMDAKLVVACACELADALIAKLEKDEKIEKSLDASSETR